MKKAINKVVTYIINKNKTISDIELLFGEDWNQNTKAKRWKYREQIFNNNISIFPIISNILTFWKLKRKIVEIEHYNKQLGSCKNV